eukprot:c9383_g1_i1.p1 GENE.c9383_g1_i1~~c9383_g1_i1.p1  ORF type:complete len:570 (-),score=115.31 c9383_g1_i1:314-1999(-)
MALFSHILVCIAALFLSIPHLCGTEEIHASNVIVRLVPDTFSSSIANGSDWFVEFFSPWCGHCQHFKPTWDKFAVEVATHAQGLIVADVDCSANFELCRSQEVPGFPTLFLYQPSKPKVTFEGSRTVEGLTEFVTSHGIVFNSADEQATNNSDAPARPKHVMKLPGQPSAEEIHLARRQARVQDARDTVLRIPDPVDVATDSSVSLIWPDQQYLMYFHTPQARNCWGCVRTAPLLPRLSRSLAITNVSFVTIACHLPPPPPSLSPSSSSSSNTTNTTDTSTTTIITTTAKFSSNNDTLQLTCDDFGIKRHRKLPVIKFCTGKNACTTFRGPWQLTNILAFVESVTLTSIAIDPDELIPPENLLTPISAWWTRLEPLNHTTPNLMFALDPHSTESQCLAVLVYSRRGADMSVIFQVVAEAVSLLSQGSAGWSVELRGWDADSPHTSQSDKEVINKLPPGLLLHHSQPPLLLVLVRGRTRRLNLTASLTPQMLVDRMFQVLSEAETGPAFLVEHAEESPAIANAKAAAVVLELGLFAFLSGVVGMCWWAFASNLSRARERKIL